MSYKSPRFDAESILQQASSDEDPHAVPVDEDDIDEDNLYAGRRARWIGLSGRMMRVPVSRIIPMSENLWYPNMLASYKRLIEERSALEAPAARVYLVTPKAVKESQQDAENGDLTEPFHADEVGEPYVVLTDGNHRAFAAILANEPYVWVRVEENSLKTAAPWLE
jgi:hypothetical protein